MGLNCNELEAGDYWRNIETRSVMRVACVPRHCPADIAPTWCVVFYAPAEPHFYMSRLLDDFLSNYEKVTNVEVILELANVEDHTRGSK